MSDTFSIKRFGSLLRLQLRTHIIPLSIAILMYFVALGCGHFLVINVASTPETTAAGHVIVMLLFLLIYPIITCLLASRSFREYHKRSTACAMLMLPCSKLEQFLAPLLLYVVVIPVIFVLGTLLIERAILLESLRLVLAKTGEQEQMMRGMIEFSSGFINHITSPSLWIPVFSVQSVFFTGAIFFKSHQLIKTIGTYILLMILFTAASAIFKDFASEISLGFTELLKFNDPEATNGSMASLISNMAVIVVMIGLSYFKFVHHKLP